MKITVAIADTGSLRMKARTLVSVLGFRLSLLEKLPKYIHLRMISQRNHISPAYLMCASAANGKKSLTERNRGHEPAAIYLQSHCI